MSISPPRLGAILALLALVLGVNLVSTVAALMGGREIRVAAAEDLEIRTIAQARAVEARLASLRGDLAFLSRSPPIVTYGAESDGGDPLIHRWRRLDAEATCLLFLEAHPEIISLRLRSKDGDHQVTAARVGGTPVLVPPSQVLPTSGRIFTGRWPLDPGRPTGADLEATSDRSVLLGLAAPDHGDALELVERTDPLPASREQLVAVAEVAAPEWSPPLSWRLVRREPAGELLGSVERLAWWFRASAGLNLGLLGLTIVVGGVTLRNVQAVARLEAEQQERERTRVLERQLLHSERLASVGRLAAGIAHEINNPLEGISNYLSLLRKELDDGRPDRAIAATDRIGDGVSRIAGVVRQTLELAGPGSDAHTIVDLGETIDRALELVTPRAQQRRVELRTARPDGDLEVTGDPVTLGQVVLNLLLNAVESQTDGGEVLVSASLRETRVEVEVSDRGPGFPPDRALEELFEPFVSTRGSTGLGLAVARRIVEGLGGTIRAERRAGGGATVRFELPRSKNRSVGSPTSSHEEKR